MSDEDYTSEPHNNPNSEIGFRTAHITHGDDIVFEPPYFLDSVIALSVSLEENDICGLLRKPPSWEPQPPTVQFKLKRKDNEDDII